MRIIRILIVPVMAAPVLAMFIVAASSGDVMEGGLVILGVVGALFGFFAAVAYGTKEYYVQKGDYEAAGKAESVAKTLGGIGLGAVVIAIAWVVIVAIAVIAICLWFLSGAH